MKREMQSIVFLRDYNMPASVTFVVNAYDDEGSIGIDWKILRILSIDENDTISFDLLSIFDKELVNKCMREKVWSDIWDH